MVGLGIVHFLGGVLEPLMRPVFNLPGAGGFVVAMGYTSGFPVGEVLTARLREARLCTQAKEKRLISFTKQCQHPLYLVSGGGGYVHTSRLLASGWRLFIMGTNLLLGVILRFYQLGRDDEAGGTTAACQFFPSVGVSAP